MMSTRSPMLVRCIASAALLFLFGPAGCSVSVEDAGGAGSGGSGGGGGLEPGHDGGLADGGCVLGQPVCRDQVVYRCDASGQLVDPQQCPSDRVCVDGRGCLACVPGTSGCSDNKAWYCTADGSGVVTFACDSVQGMQCTPTGCQGPCSPSTLSKTHLGCDFWPTITANSVWKQWFSFGVIVTNPTQAEAHLTVTQGQEVLQHATVPADGYVTLELPWIDELKGPDAASDGVVSAPTQSVWSHAEQKKGAYRVRSDQPVSVMQFNPLAAQNPEGASHGCPNSGTSEHCLSYSNDASLLVPAHALGTSYSLLGWHAWHLDSAGAQPGLNMGDFVAITATSSGVTRLQITPTSPTLSGPELPALEPARTSLFDLQQGDVLELFTEGAAATQQWAGSTVVANQPVQVITGAPCVNVPDAVGACDHIEEWVAPQELLGKRYVVAYPQYPWDSRRSIVRVQSLSEQTIVTFDPPSVHPAITLRAGEALSLELDQDFQISSTNAFALTQYLVGHEAAPASTPSQTAGLGDPSQTLLVPISRYLNAYDFATPAGFAEQWLTLVVATGTQVSLNAQTLDSAQFTAVGASGLSVARLPLQPGTHYRLRGDQPLGAQLYGFGRFSSFMAPLGIDLRPPVSR